MTTIYVYKRKPYSKSLYTRSMNNEESQLCNYEDQYIIVNVNLYLLVVHNVTHNLYQDTMYQDARHNAKGHCDTTSQPSTPAAG